jgi:hypothetical protein
MALSVLKPGDVIHPVVGSIFSAPKPGVPLERLGDEESVVSREGRESARESVSEAALSSPLEIRPRAAADAIVDERPSSLVTTRQSAASSMLPLSSLAETESPGPASSEAVDEGDRRVESSTSAAETQTTSAKRIYAPLISEDFAPSSPPVAAFGLSKNSGAASSPPFSPPSRPADDIQIHIGRIEVTAVQPAPARAAPAKPQRRAPSLDEYLRRRDGRSS